jgi:hypothetical protein
VKRSIYTFSILLGGIMLFAATGTALSGSIAMALFFGSLLMLTIGLVGIYLYEARKVGAFGRVALLVGAGRLGVSKLHRQD